MADNASGGLAASISISALWTMILLVCCAAMLNCRSGDVASDVDSVASSSDIIIASLEALDDSISLATAAGAASAAGIAVGLSTSTS